MFTIGKCAGDGLYYHNEKSFVVCSNGNAVIQPCAPGSANSGFQVQTIKVIVKLPRGPLGKSVTMHF